MKNTSVCSICEEGELHAQVGSNPVEYKNTHKELPMHYSECECCGSEITLPEQSRTNKRLMIAFKKEVDGLLTGSQLKELRNTLGLTQAEAARIFGGGPVAFSKYEADDVTQSEAMDKLLRLAAEIPAASHKLMVDAGVERKAGATWRNVTVVNFGVSKSRKTKVVKSHELELEEYYG
ncbi:type II toxin-antitoxin system MqsA family antitoxin [Pseudoalteromonas nigrifaciens]|uniref:type II toxin-antitoxin system MqsA family antitoxin n=1 Tax=Pseudoalteromonas nigrifaciens TaxID=28109 RepID=UPI003FD05EE1